MKLLNKRQIRMLHQHLADETGGSPGLRDEGLLDSALNVSFQIKESDDLSAWLLVYQL